MWTRTLLVGAMALGTLVLSSAGVQVLSDTVAHAAACDTWYGPGGGPSAATSGLWGVSTNWSTGVIPASTDDVCINLPGTYTVTLAPWSLGTADPNNNGANVNSMTLGAASGVQTLDIVGQASISNSNETLNTVFLNLATTSTINARATVILDSTSGGTSAGGAPPSGGSAVLTGGSLLNYGHIIAQVEDTFTGKGTFLSPYGFVNEPGSTLQVNSGTLSEGQVNVSSATNEGTVTIESGASWVLTPNTFSTTTFTNEATVVNRGSITVNNATWAQRAGSITGNAVVLQSAATLADTAGPAHFLQNYGTVTITGTIPSTQTVTVLGEPFNYQGETYYSSTLSLGGANLVNDGSLILEATGKGTTSGGSVYLIDGAVINKGTIRAEILDPSWVVHLQAGVANHHGGAIVVTGGQLAQDTATATSNDGLISVGPGATYLLQEGATLKSARDSTTQIQIAGAKKYGQFGLAGPCCAGPGVFTAGGSLSAELVSGYKPAAGHDFPVVALEGGQFKGKFLTTSRHFRADYSREGASPAFVGAIYASSPPSPRVVSISASKDKVIVVLSCPRSGPACSRATVTATVASRHLVVAIGAVTLKAGSTKTLTVVVNRAGLALFAKSRSYAVVVKVTSGAHTIRTSRVVVLRPGA